MTQFVALLRGINVGGKNKLPMADLRHACEALGFSHIQSYIQSGNLAFDASQSGAAIETRLEAAIAKSFALDVPVVVRKSTAWRKIIASNPFPGATADRPAQVQLFLAKRNFPKPVVRAIAERAAHGERVAVGGGALWVDFPNGIARSKLTSAFLDSATGTVVTGRNLKTVQKVSDMLEIEAT